MLEAAIKLWLDRLLLRNELGDDECQAIRDLPFERVVVPAHRDFVRLGELTDRSCLVADGLVGRFSQCADGSRQITALHIPGDMADLHSAALPAASSALCALTNSTILRVPHAALHQLASRYPGLARAFWRDCVADAASLSEWALNLGCRSAYARTAHLLVELTIRYFMIGQLEGTSFRMPANQTHIGDVTGMTSVHVNRMLRELREAGLVTVSAQTATIDNWKGLNAAASYDPRYLQVPKSVLQALATQLDETSRSGFVSNDVSVCAKA